MDAEYKDMNESAPIPSLTLEPELDNTPKLVVAEETQLQQPKVAEPVLTPQEQQMVNDFAQKIDVENTAQILQYGAGTQKKMADFSDAALANVRTQDLGEVGDLIVNVVGELKGFDAEEEKGFFGFFRKQANKLEVMKSRYAKAEVNVEKIGDALQQHQVRLLKDSAMLDKMYEQNLAYFKELTMYILAGKKKLQEVREGKLKELEATAQATGLAEDAQAAKDLADKCNRFEKKIYDLELTRTISIQTAPQIRMIQNNDNVMVEKIQTTLMNTIPLWKNQMVLALGMAPVSYTHLFEPMSKWIEKRTRPVLPLYLAALTWPVASLILPPYRLVNLVIIAALSTVVYLVSSRFCPTRVQRVEQPYATGSENTDAMLNGIAANLDALHKLNDAIPDAELSRQLDRMEKAGRGIVQAVEQKPDKARTVDRFARYYLPEVVKIMSAYAQMEKGGITGENAAQILSEVRRNAGTMATAFENQLDALYSAEAMDISTDIEVLENIMRGQNLT